MQICVEVEDKEAKLLEDALVAAGVTGSQRQLLLVKLLKASFADYSRLVRGGGLPMTMSDVRLTRLYFVVQHVYDGSLPSEAQVASLFQITRTQARALVRNFIARYRQEFDEALRSAIKTCLSAATEVDDGVEVQIASDVVVDYINDLLEAHRPELRPLKRITNARRLFHLGDDARKVVASLVDRKTDR